MLKNLESLKISKLFFILVICFSCDKEYSDLHGVSLLTNKKIIIYDKEVIATGTYFFKGDDYALERDLHFDRNGKITKIGRAKAEGLLYYYKTPAKLQLGLSPKDSNFSIKIDTINHWIIENNDTIREFKVNRNTKIIYTPENQQGRVFIYEFE